MAETLQLDLFGEVETADTERLVGALTCLRDAVPDAMEVVVHLGPWCGDPRRPGLIDWVNSLTAPDRWVDLTRPYELWPEPETWHPEYLEGDHERPGWDMRLDAWRALQAILTDAAGAVVA